jgi:ABC-2 type transport system ATP-binding protein
MNRKIFAPHKKLQGNCKVSARFLQELGVIMVLEANEEDTKMSEYVLRTNQLTKRYKDFKANDGVNMTIPKGAIYGFIGQNGAGKSTLIRLINGLAFPTSGTFELFGKSSAPELIEARRRMGAIIEGPALYPNMSAKDNLEAHRLLMGIPGKEVVPRLLEVVGLQRTGKKKAKDFSLGMKQRLGLAIALLGDPEFLILDEPLNGLDPMGVVEIRELLKELNQKHGITILISSHVLGELQLVATHYGIIHGGKLVEEVTAQQLEAKCESYLRLSVDDTNLAVAVLEEKLGTTAFEVMPDATIKLFDFVEEATRVSGALFGEGVSIAEISKQGENLESYFMNKIGGINHA